MTDLRKAAEQALKDLTRLCHAQAYDTVEALRQALAQPEQKPVAWMYEWDGRINFTTTDQRFVEAAHPHFVKSTPLYTAPPKREWVGLTDADIAKAMHGSVEGSNMLPYQFARAIESKLKEKNT
jgi:hypothetical protein